MKFNFIDHSIKDIINFYKQKTLSPLDVAHFCNQQVESLEPNVHAWVCYSADYITNQAEDCQKYLDSGKQPRALEGVPIGIKDIFNTCHFPTQMGSPLWKDFYSGNDARVVYYLKEAGGIIPGKTVTAEFAVHALDKTLNPFDPSKTPGTSSSGSAVATALGMVPAALGTQTAGSIIRPASFCGVYGFKPSFGLIPRTGILKTTDSLDSVGFFTIHFEDIITLFDCIRVTGQNFPLSNTILTNTSRQTKHPERPWKIAFVKPHVWEHAYDYAKEAMTEFVNRLSHLSLSSLFEVVEVDLPQITEKSHHIHANIYNKTLSYYFKEEFKKSELVSPIMNTLIEEGNNITVEEYREALTLQDTMAREMDSFLSDFDVVITLSTAGEAPPREEAERPDSALLWNMSYLPVMNIPAFVSPDGLPFGLQVISRRYNDYLLIHFIDDLIKHELIPPRINPIAKIKPAVPALS
ncbi:MAG: amidase [Cyanobacteria bacterium]|nr:amidase [Cyanobacteriota bacterium]